MHHTGMLGHRARTTLLAYGMAEIIQRE